MKIKNRLLLSFLSVYCMLCFYIATSAQPSIIFLSGPSSVGKTSIHRALSPLLEGPTQVIEIDRVALDILYDMVKERGYVPETNEDILTLVQRCQGTILSKEDIIGLYPRAQKKAYEYLRKCFLEGKNVIIETVVVGAYETRICVEELHDLPVLFCFVYCSPYNLLKHVQERNRVCNRHEHRSAIVPFKFFMQMCKSTEDDNQCIDSLHREDTKCLFQKMRSGVNDEQSFSEVNELQDSFLKKFGLDQKEEVKIALELEYDAIIDTTSCSSQECAQHIASALPRINRKAIKKNYNKIRAVPISSLERSSLEELCGVTTWDTAKTYKIEKAE